MRYHDYACRRSSASFKTHNACMHLTAAMPCSNLHSSPAFWPLQVCMFASEQHPIPKHMHSPVDVFHPCSRACSNLIMRKSCQALLITRIYVPGSRLAVVYRLPPSCRVIKTWIIPPSDPQALPRACKQHICVGACSSWDHVNMVSSLDTEQTVKSCAEPGTCLAFIMSVNYAAAGPKLGGFAQTKMQHVGFLRLNTHTFADRAPGAH